MLLLVATVFVIFLTLRVFYTLFLRDAWRSKSECVDEVMIVIGSGGHTAEMLRLAGRLDTCKFRRRTYLLADSDTSSQAKVEACESGREDFSIRRVPRMRAPLQSWTSALKRAPRALSVCFSEVFRTRPQLLLCNGPGTCVPVVLAALVLDILGLTRTRIVFIESICRVKTLSISGRLLYGLLWKQRFLVQWPELALKYPRATYIGQLV
jgi:beta-1,4-N-acetylglucosaminyltransferase